MGMGSSFVGGLDSALALKRLMAQRGQAVGRSARATPQAPLGLSGMSLPSDTTDLEAENRLRAFNAGQIPSTEELAAREAEKTRAAATLKDQNARTDERQAATDDYVVGIRDERMKREASAEDKRRFGITDTRAGEKHKAEMETHDIEMEKAKYAQNLLKRVDDHKSMMQAFFTGDVNAVMGWFIRNGPKQPDGSQKIPIIEQGDEQGMYNVTWPGADEAEPMDRENLGKLLMRLNPRYEMPKSAVEEATIEATKNKGALSQKDLIDLQIKNEKNKADPELMNYQEPPGLRPQVSASKASGMGKADTGESPPVQGAKKGKDGNWYVQKDGKTYRVDKDKDEKKKKKKPGEGGMGGSAE